MLLDALTYAIDADNSKLNQEIKSSEKKVDDLTKSMSDAEKRAATMKDKMVGYFKTIGVAMLAAVSVSKILSSVDQYAKATEAVRSFAETTGMAVEDADSFGKAVETIGGSAEGARGAIFSFTGILGQALAGTGQGEKIFSEFGIRLKDAQGQVKNTTEVLLELSDAVKNLSPQEATARLGQLGITDQKTIEIMLKGRQELERRMQAEKDSNVVTKEAAEEAKKYTLAIARWQSAQQNITDAIARFFLPIITKIIDAFSSVVEWIGQHGDFITGFLITIGTILAVTYGPAAISAAVATWGLIAPFLAAAAPIIALGVVVGLLVDDIMRFMEGNDSLIGQIAKVFPAIGDWAKYMYNIVSGIFKLLTGDFEGAEKAFAEAGQNIIDMFKHLKESVVQMLDALFEWIGFGPGVATEMAEGIEAAFNDLVGWLMKIFASIGDLFDALMDVFKGGPKKAKEAAQAMLGVFSSMSDSIKGVFNSLVAFVEKIWNWIKGIYDKSVGLASGIADKVGGWFSFGGKDDSAKQGLAAASSNPLNSTTSNAISNSSSSRSETNVAVGQVTVQTQATDAEGISKDIGGELQGQLKNLQSESASGVAR